MDPNYQQYHRGNYPNNGSERNRPLASTEDCEDSHHLPMIIMKESELLYISDPEKLLGDYMKLRCWTYKLDVIQENNKFKAVVDIESEDQFSQTSNNQKKALVKVIIYVLYHYNSMLASIWIARHQGLLKDYIR